MHKHRKTQDLHTSLNSTVLPFPPPVIPADMRPDILSHEGGHVFGHGSVRGQPVGVVITGCEVADVVDIAEHEGHGAKSAQAATGCA